MTETLAEQLLRLTEEALDQFDSVPLAQSVRRALRIARLNGDADAAWWNMMELKPVGGSKKDIAARTQELWPEDSWERVTERHSYWLEEWIKERAPTSLNDDEDKMLGGSVWEMEARLEQIELLLQEAIRDKYWEGVSHASETSSATREVLDRIRSRCYRYLVSTEATLRLSANASGIFERHRRLVDDLVGQLGPEVLDKLGSAIRRLLEGDVEARSQALTSCRRVFEAVADIVYPARDTPYVNAKGNEHEVKQSNYRNRIAAFCESVISNSLGEAIMAGLDECDQSGR